MKQFNLEEYLTNPNRKIITRDGRSARIICTNRLDENYTVIALINNEDSEQYYCYTAFGKLYVYQNRDCELDLFFAPVKKSGWINLYRINSITAPGAQVYDTEEEAKSKAGCSNTNYISTIKIKWEE